MPHDVSKLEFEADPAAQAAARRKLEARPQPDADPVEAGKAAMDRHPIVMARLAE